jgi:hypothetical protein
MKTAGDVLFGSAPTSDAGVVDVTSSNFPGFRPDQVFVNAEDAQRIFKVFFPNSGVISQEEMTLDDRAFAQFLLMKGVLKTTDLLTVVPKAAG